MKDVNTILEAIDKERHGEKILYLPIPSLSELLKDFTVSRVDSPERLRYILPKLVGQTVLDIGCSEGYFTCELAKMGYQVTAIDRSPHMVAVVQALAAINELRVDYEVCDWEEHFNREVYYDNVLLLSIFHHTIEERGPQAFEVLVKIRGKATRVFIEIEWLFVKMPPGDVIRLAGEALNMGVKEVSHPGWRDIILYESSDLL